MGTWPLPDVEGVGTLMPGAGDGLVALGLPLLTPEQVRVLAFWAEAGVFAQERLDTGRAEADVAALQMVSRLGEQSVERLVRSNVRLVAYWISRDWSGRRRSTGGLEVADLEAAGVAGLIRTVRKYDHTLGFAFSTYASNWIRQFIRRAVEQAASDGMTNAEREAVTAMMRARDALWRQLGRRPSTVELAQRMELSAAAVADLLLLERCGSSVSLGQPVSAGDQGSVTVADLLPDALPGPETAAEANAVRQHLDAALSHLSARERAVVAARVGWDAEPLDEVDVAARFGVSAAAVRSVVEQALTRLRSDEDVLAAAA